MVTLDRKTNLSAKINVFKIKCRPITLLRSDDNKYASEQIFNMWLNDIITIYPF